jgi:beta-lactamase class A
MASAREAAATYVIQPGDTLLNIAGVTGVPMDKIVGLNGLTDPDVIIAGKILKLQPGAAADQAAAAAAAPTGPARYTVKGGDTLWDIATANGVGLDALIKANNLSDADKLSIGQQLALPEKQKPAAPKPAPTPQPKPNLLQQKILSEAQRVGGTDARVGVAAINLVSGEHINVKADETFPSASVMKLPILVELERQVAAGSVKWNDNLRTDTAQMISVSDNAAANRIADMVSMVAVNDNLRKLGLGGTRFLNTFTDSRTPANPGQNQTTPANMARLLELIATDQIVSGPVSAEIRGLLARNADRSKLVRLLPADAKVAHKSGWYDGVANDVGLVTVERVPTRWVIAVFTEHVPDAETGNQLVATISKAVYDAWAQ